MKRKREYEKDEKENIKKILALSLMLTIGLPTITGCSNNTTNDNSSNSNSSNSSTSNSKNDESDKKDKQEKKRYEKSKLGEVKKTGTESKYFNQYLYEYRCNFHSDYAVYMPPEAKGPYNRDFFRIYDGNFNEYNINMNYPH